MTLTTVVMGNELEVLDKIARPLKLASAVAVCMLTASFSGCAVKVVREDLLVKMPPPKSDSEEVAMFTTEQSPPCLFEEIGLVSSVKKGAFVTMGQVNSAMRKEARKMGGDAIINVRVGKVELENRVNPSGIKRLKISNTKNPFVEGIVVRWLDPDCAKKISH